MRTCAAAGVCAARYASGERPNSRLKLVVKEPRLQADVVANHRNRTVGGAQQCRGALESPGEQVLVRRLAEAAAELTAEVGP